MKKILILALVLSTTIIAAQESVKLRLNYTKGDKYIITMKQTMNTPAMMMNNTTEMNMEVIDSKDDVFTSEMKISKMVMDIMQGGMQMSYDSSKSIEDQDQMAQMLKPQVDPMLKAVITSKNDAFGKVIEIKVEPSTPATEQFKNQSSISYPKNAVKVGDTWKDENDTQGVKSLVEYKVTGITADKVTLSASGTISGAAEGIINGTFEVERATGITLTSSMKNTMKVQGQDMKMNIDITMQKK